MGLIWTKKLTKLANRPPTKAMKTVVILENVQSLVKLTPYNTEHTDHF